MLPCYRCGASAVGANGVCANCGALAYQSPYAMPSVPMRERRSVKGLGVALMVSLGVTGVAIAVFAASQVRRHQVVTQLIDSMNGSGDAPALSTVQSSDDFVRAAAVGWGLTIVVTIVLMLTWMYRARTNAETYGLTSFNLGRGFAIGGWFIPLANYVLPCIVFRDIHKGTVAGRGPGRPSGGAITGWWWGFYVASIAFLVGGAQSSGKKDRDLSDPIRELHGLQTGSAGIVPGLVLLIVAGILGILYVRKITGIQTARAGEPYGGVQAGYGVPGYGHAFGQPVYGQAPYGQAPYGQPPYGQAPYGAPAGYGQPAYGAPQYAPYGTPVPGQMPQQNPYGAPTADAPGGYVPVTETQVAAPVADAVPAPVTDAAPPQPPQPPL